MVLVTRSSVLTMQPAGKAVDFLRHERPDLSYARL
jgi:hypothetical protein